MPVSVLVVHARGPRVDALRALLAEATPAMRVEVVDDPHAGLERLVHTGYHAAIVEADLPGAGPMFISDALERGCRTPLLLLADEDDPEQDQAAQDAGAAGFLVRGGLTSRSLVGALRYARAACRAGELRSARLFERLARNAVHEGKNALAGLRSGLQVLGAGVTPGTPEEEIYREIQSRLSAFDERLEDLSLLIRPLRPAPADVRLDALLGAAARTIRESCSVPIVIEPTDVELQADARLLEQALLAILRNAAEALGDTAEPIHVSARASAGECCVEVRDAGPGLPIDVDDALLPFSTTKLGVAGLGLPLALRIARAHGGDLTLRSAPGGGVTVELRLPLA